MSPIITLNNSGARAKVGPPSNVVTPYVTEDYAGGVRENAFGSGGTTPGVFRWTTPRGDVSVVTFDGRNCLRVRYPATAPNGQSDPEQRYWLGVETRQLWIEYDLHIPSNFTHRDQPTATENNKFLNVWRDPYDGGPDLACWFGGFEFVPTASFDGNSRLRMTARGRTGSVSVGDITDPGRAVTVDGMFAPMIGGSGPLVIGAWNTIRAEFVMASSESATDGRMGLWANGTYIGGTTTGMFWDHTSGNKTTAPGTFFNRGYFMGASNSGYAAQTDFHLTAHKFYLSDPGWRNG